MSDHTQVAVIGGGPGGYAAAFKAADLDLDVTLIDPEANPGGVCLYRGCIPSKALLHVARVINESREAANWGLSFGEPEIDLDRLREWKNGVVTKLTGGLGQLTKTRKIKHIQGTATFSGSQSLEITTVDGENQSLDFDHAILAAGSRPTVIPAFDIGSDRVMDSTDALDLADVPKSLLVIGGGYIGLELGTVYAALGSKVSVVEMLPGLLPGADRDLVKILHKGLEERFEEIMLETRVESLKEQKNGIRVRLAAAGDEESHDRIFEKVLISIGRRPNTENLGLENTGVVVGDDGFVRVNAQRRTDDEYIYCIGDLAGQPMLAHKASHEGIVAAEVIAGEKAAFEPRAIPAVVFTDPEIAWAGLTETEAKEQDIDYKLVKFPWAASGRALAVDRTDGLTKLLIDPETERVIGVGICGVNAGEMIAEGVLAIEMAALASDVKLSIHPHPTLSETVMESAELFYGASTHQYRRSR